MARRSVEVNTKGWRDLKKRVMALDGTEARIGWFSGQNYGPENQNLPIAQVAQFNEEGHINGGWFAGTVTPSRPFIRSFFISLKKSNDFKLFVANELKWYLDGKRTRYQTAKAIAELVRKGLRETVEKWTHIPNSPATIALKGRNDPLVETGTMAKSIAIRIVREVGSKVR